MDIERMQQSVVLKQNITILSIMNEFNIEKTEENLNFMGNMITDLSFFVLNLVNNAIEEKIGGNNVS